MAPGSKLDSCKRTSFSTFAFWVLIWLTCLFLEKVQCTFDPDPAQAWLMPAKMRELESAHDLFDLVDTSPWPESATSPRGIGPRPPPGSDPHHDDHLVSDTSSWTESAPVIHGINMHPPTGSGYFDDILHTANWPRPESHPIPHGIDPRPLPASDSHHDEFYSFGKIVDDGLFVLENSLWPESAPILSDTNTHLPTKLDDLHNILPHFANSPTPESQPILSTTNTHPSPAQRKRENDLDEAEATMRKKMKASSDTTDLPYEIINSERPVESEIEVVYEAIRSLELINGNKLIGNEQEGEYKMLKIPEDQISTFLVDLVHKRGTTDVFQQSRISKPRPVDQATIVFARKQEKRRLKALKKVTFKDSVPEFRSRYIDCVMPEFENSMKEARSQAIKRNFSSRLLKELDHILNVLPLYLFHVYLINTVIPVQGMGKKGVPALKSQRQEAGEKFFNQSELI
ncbi:hypothetical protein PtA15_12A372 [Puccinia triticina]|uniref:Uncharacterized protein n=1 Tax=Puccinia triticina TaxID=208348 RepID=A0ABY7CYK1_9BASI|nr:uncharacterized protein PtA15_12A372 [Puccinia triticina]WAQ90383.1 hypothetical protein PtA15_12A372 [Puccinia triticina]